MRESKDLGQGTLDMLILQTISVEPKQGGGAIPKRIRQVSKEALQIQQGSLYPALHRLEQQGWVRAQWAETESGSKAKFYSLTRAGYTWTEKELAARNRSLDLRHRYRVLSRNPQITTVAAFSLTLGIGANAVANLAVAAKPPDTGNVRVCLNPNNYVSGLVLAHAEDIASRIFASAGVALEWHTTAPAVCRGLQQTKTVVLDFARDTPAGEHPSAMAYARPYEGIHIVVMYGRIEENAEGPMRVSTVLGHVMAHEITHVVQGIARHSQTGVMKAHWNAQDFCQMMHKPLPFTPEDVDLIQNGLRPRAPSVTPAVPLPVAPAFH
jgi:PadR family transcriptional regulator PadR